MDPSELPRRTRPKQVHLWLSQREYERLRRAADDQHRSVSSMIRQLISERLAARPVTGERLHWNNGASNGAKS